MLKPKPTFKSLEIELNTKLVNELYESIKKYGTSDAAFRSGENLYEPHHLDIIENLLNDIYKYIDEFLASFPGSENNIEDILLYIQNNVIDDNLNLLDLNIVIKDYLNIVYNIQ